ncbi:MAG: HDOD domain-containing protein, partial [Lachnospiraceae bacterium]|nr:HDOD domain-containing protein [Lachnospiraceae bacterium]
MLGTLIPLFDSSMEVKAYSIFSQKENMMKNPSLLGTGSLSGIGQISGLDILSSMGMKTLSNDKTVFVEVNNISVFTEIELMVEEPHSNVVLLMDNGVNPSETYVQRLKELKDAGFGLAIRKLQVKEFEQYRPILALMDYVLLNHKKIDIEKAKIYFTKVYPHIKLVAVNVDTQEDYELLTYQGGYDLYEGRFFRIPKAAGDAELSPLKANYIELLNVVNGPDFDLTKAAGVIEHDTALVISLLEMVNRMAVNSGINTVRHAAAMLGQKELKRWINTAVTRELCSEKPNEITRMSLLRGRFMERLAEPFGLGAQSGELFLMGMFSVLDVMLDMPMEEALQRVRVSAHIEEGLLKHTGPFDPVYEFMLAYEDANWTEVSRILLLDKIDEGPVYTA